MDIKEFQAGEWIPQFQYKSFLPSKINREWIISDPVVNKLLEEANLKIGELNAFSYIVPDVDIFIKMHILKEAVQSSRIEGTRTNIEEAAQKERDIDPEKRDEWREIRNYTVAVNSAVESLKNVPISSRLIKQSHQILLESVRGRHKLPGEYRTSQNWIGGATIKDAVFIPPHQNDINDLLYDLENFINNDQVNIPHLIKIAIIHYQFETIHPFLDGNGRVGRLLITLYLIANGLLNKPTLYLSDFFEKNKQLYYDNLTIVRTRNDLIQWIKFFLSAVINTSENAISTFQKILKLRDVIEGEKLIILGKKLPVAKRLLNRLYSDPFITVQDAGKDLKVSKPTANSLIKYFVELEILHDTTGLKRNRKYVFKEYIELFK